jgi:hypothetical protein
MLMQISSAEVVDAITDRALFEDEPMLLERPVLPLGSAAQANRNRGLVMHGLVESHRHHHGRYSTLRVVDLRRPKDPRPDTPLDDDGVEDASRRSMPRGMRRPASGMPAKISDEDGRR